VKNIPIDYNSSNEKKEIVFRLFSEKPALLSDEKISSDMETNLDIQEGLVGEGKIEISQVFQTVQLSMTLELWKNKEK
jgi:hypothetical protein